MSYNQLQLAEALIQDGELDDALQAIGNYLNAFPADPDARRLRAGILLRVGEGDQLEIALGDLSSLPELTPEDVINCATIWERLGDSEQAQAVLESGLVSYPEHPRLTEHFVILLKSKGKIQQAYQLIQEQSDDDWRWRSWAGELAEELGDHDEAIRHFSAALVWLSSRIAPDTGLPARSQSSRMTEMMLFNAYARLLVSRGNACQNVGDWSQAASDFATAAELLPGDSTILLKQGIVAWHQHKKAAAIRLCEQAFAVASPLMHDRLLDYLTSYPGLLEELRGAGLIS